MDREDRLRELEERYEGYTVYDRDGDKIGKVDDLFVDEEDREEYIGVKMGLFGLSGTTLIPSGLARINDEERSIEVSETKEHVKDAPTYSDDDEVTAEFEDRIREHFGLEPMEPAGRSAYGRYVGATAGGTAESGAAAGVTSAEAPSGRGMDRERGEDAGAGRTVASAGDREAPGGAVRDVENEDRGLLGRESYQNREDMGVEGSAMGTAGAREGTPTGGVPDLETGEPGRARGEDVEREGISRGELGDREDLGATGTTTGAGPVEGDLPRRGAGDYPEGEGYPGRGAGAAERSDAPMTSSGGALGVGDTPEPPDGERRRVGEEGFRQGAEREGVEPGGIGREREGIGASGTIGAGEEGLRGREDIDTPMEPERGYRDETTGSRPGAAGGMETGDLGVERGEGPIDDREGIGGERLDTPPGDPMGAPAGAGTEPLSEPTTGGAGREGMAGPEGAGYRDTEEIGGQDLSGERPEEGLAERPGERSAAPVGETHEGLRDRPEDHPRGGAQEQEEEGTLTRVWRRIRG